MQDASISDLLAEPMLGDGGTYPDLLRHMTTFDPDLLAIEWSGGKISYGQLLSMVAAEAEYLTGLGIGPGDVVASMVTSHPYSLANHLAVVLIGALSAPVYIESEGAVLAKTLNVFQAKAVVAMPAAIPKLEAIMGDVPTLEHIVSMLDSDFDRMMQEGRDIGPWLESAHPDPTDPCLLLSTSGTTGTPKAVIFAHSTGNSGYLMARKWGIPVPAKVYITTSWGHGAVSWQVAIAYWFGGSVVLPDRFTASGFWDDVRRYDCTIALLFGPMIRAVFNKMDEAGTEIPAGTDFHLISAGCPPDLWKRLTDAGVKIFEVYSSSEAWNAADACMIISNPDGRYQTGSAGRPWSEHEARIVDDEGNVVDEGQIGELHMKPVGKSGVVKYYNNTTAAEGLVVDGWVKTGDYFYQKDGDYFFVARKRDIIRRRGINMSPGSIEDELQKHPAFETVVALATPSALGEEEIKVVVVPVAGATVEPREVAQFASENLPRHMRPRYVEVVASIPSTQGNGRPQRVQLERKWRTASTWDTEEERYLQPEAASTGATR